MISFRVLGPVTLGPAGGCTDLGTPMLRGFTAALLMHPGESVSHPRLMDTLWDRPPISAVANMRGYAVKLRRALSSIDLPGRLVTCRRAAGGYRLTVHAEELDSARFANLVHAGRAALRRGDPATAVATLDQALSLWRGPAGDDVPATLVAKAQFDALNERRVDALVVAAEGRLLLEIGRAHV